MRRILALLISLLLLLPEFAADCAAEEEIYKSVENTKMQIALTFDDGPHPGRTPEILDILEEYGIKATFFVVGENARLHPDIIQRELQEGHEIGNHTYTHKILSKCTKKALKKEIYDFEECIFEICEYLPRLIRPPGGMYDSAFSEFVRENNYTVVLWSVDTRDWSHPTEDKIVNTVLDYTQSGSIILMHDYIAGSSPTPAALKKIIPALLGRGFEFVTASELIDNAIK